MGIGISGPSVTSAAEDDLFAWKPNQWCPHRTIILVVDRPNQIQVHDQAVLPGIYSGISSIYLSLKGLRDSLPNPSPAELEWLEAELGSWENARMQRVYKSDVYILKEMSAILNSYVLIDDVRNNQLKAWPESYPQYPRMNMLIIAAGQMFHPDLPYFLLEAHRRDLLSQDAFLDESLKKYVRENDEHGVRIHFYDYGRAILCYLEFAIAADQRSQP
jgi:hypothetical protein